MMSTEIRQIERILEGAEAIVFDWDDTLVDTSTGKLAQNMAVAKHFGIDRTETEVRELYSSGMAFKDMIIELCNHEVAYADIMEFVEADYNSPEYAKKSIEGAEHGVRTLKELGYRTALFTATSPDRLDADIASPGFDLEVFSTSPMHVPDGMRKSDRRAFTPVATWLREQDISVTQSVYVGDGLGDMDGALGAGMQFIGIDRGLVSAESFRRYGVLSLPGVEELASIAANMRR